MFYVLLLIMLSLFISQYNSLSASTTSVSDQATLFELGPLSPKSEKGIITSFKYVADQISSFTKISYTYVENTSIEQTIYTKTTKPTLSTGTNMTDLQRHSLDCGSGYALSGFSLQNNGTFIWYAYECRKGTINACGTQVTNEFLANGGQFIGCDLSHFKNCPQAGDGADNTVMQGFSLITRFDTSGVGYFKYQYIQCSIMLCDVACNGCYNGGTPLWCKTCATDNGYYPVVTNINYCVNKDPGGYHLDHVTWKWEINCLPQCLKCSGWGYSNNHQCTECATGYFPLLDLPSNCYSSNPGGYFLNSITKRWESCYYTCNDCSGQGNDTDHMCLTCQSNYFPVEDKPNYCIYKYWYQNVLTGYYLNSATQRFEKCFSTCNSCDELGTNENNKCTACISNYYFLEYTANCISYIPYGYWLLSNSRWIQCYPSCGRCYGNGGVNNHFCSECRTDYFPLQDQHENCYQTLPIGYFFNSGAQRWDNCYPSCQTCDIRGIDTDHKCTNCRSSFYPLQDKPASCYDVAPYGYYNNTVQKRWDNCYLSCAWCTGLGTTDIHKCTACRTGYYQMEGKESNCANTRPDGYFFNNTVSRWELCHPSCSSCTGLGDANDQRCTTCLSSELYYPLQDITSQCFKERQPGYFWNSAQQRWDNCYSSCDDCTGLGTENDHLCKMCKSGYYPLVDKLTSCFLTRPTGYFYNSTELKWINCYSSCDSCTGQGTAEAHLCQTCISQYYPLQDNSTLCYNTVQPGYFNNSALKRWDKCYSSCTSCTGLGNADDHLCIQCKTGFFPLQDKSSKCYDTTPPAYFKNATANRWDNCYPPCGSCTEFGTPDNHLCSSCNAGYYPRKNESPAMCYNTASYGHYLNVNIWDFCLESCAYCTAYLTGTDHMCTECATDYYPLQNQTSKCFVSTVPVSGYFFNDTAKRWDNCYSSCDSCEKKGNETDHLCTTCLSGFLTLEDKSSNCYDIAPEGYYLNQNRWDLCYNSCKECSRRGTTDNHLCTKCKTRYYPLQDNQTMCFCRTEDLLQDGVSMCSNTVPKEYYYNTSQQQWNLCYSSCDSCDALGTDNDHKCTKCTSNYYPLQDKNSSCYSTNQSGYFFNSTLERWDNCYPSCSKCPSLGNDTDHLCTECKIDYYPLQDTPSTCYATTPYGYYFNATKWDHCYTSCASCSSLGTSADHYCTQCRTGYYPLEDYPSMCLDQVKYGYYLNESMQIWDLCLNSCGYCTGLGTLTGDHMCSECAKDYYPLIDKPTRCYSTTPYGYYFNNTLKSWENCFPSCGQCPDIGTEVDHLCTECRTGYYPLIDFQSKCYSTAPQGYYLNTISQLWEHCFYTCNSCTGPGAPDEHLCIQCYQGYYPLQDRYSMCYAEAPNPYVFNALEMRWDLCYQTCKYCTALGDESDHKCTTCNEPFYPLQDKPSNCIGVLPPGYFFNAKPQRWDNCYISCATCEESGTPDDNKCISCKTDYFAVENSLQCLKTSPMGYYFDQNKKMHLKCDDNCETCANLSTSCVTCNSEFYFLLENNRCVQSCPDGYFSNEALRTCDKCSESCVTCINDREFCLTCKSGFFFLNNTCNDKCPTNYFQDSSTMKCLLCYEKCKTCQGVNKSDCLSCIDEFPFLREGQCTASCLDDELYLPAEGKCIKLSLCIIPPTLNVPSRYSIESSDFKASVRIELTSECLKYQENITQKFTYEWSDLYNGSLSQGNTTLTIAAANLNSGNKNFTVNVSFSKLAFGSVTKICQFKTNLLVPVVKNSEKLLFVLGYPIRIDASLSYDEELVSDAFSSNINDPELVFQWICPTQINTKCALYKNKILTLTPDDYSGLTEAIQQVQEYSCAITLILSKGTRTSQKNLTVLISNPSYGTETSNSTSTSNTTISEKKNYEQLAVIQPVSRGMKNEDLIFEVIFLDPTINITNFGFYWTVGNLENPAKYLNGRIEDIARIKNAELPFGETIINLDFYEKNSTAIKYAKKYRYTKSQAPYGGNCQANPSRGFSLGTTIAFSATGWLSSNLPLSYKFYMTNRNGFNVSLTEDTIPLSEYSTWIIPVGNKFFADVIDSAGLSSTYPCDLVIDKFTSPSQNLPVLNDLLNKTTSAKMKLLLVEAYNSNDFPVDSAAVETSAAILENMLDTSSNQTLAKSIGQNMDIILSQLSSVLSSNFKSTAVNEIIDKVISSVVNNMDSIVQDSTKVGDLVNIISNNYDNIQQTQETNITSSLVKNENYIKEMQIKVSQNLVSGQTLTLSSKNFVCQIGKISKINTPNYSIIDTSSSRLRQRRLQSNEDGCPTNSAVCLSSDLLKNISAQVPGEITIMSKLSANGGILPISEESFGETSLELNIASQNQGTLRILSSNDLMMTYTVRLQAPYLNSSTVQTKINETACVQYDNNYKSDSASCATWYDYDTMEIVCICTKQGLTVNVFDKTFSSFSKLAQFPALTGDLINVYSLSIVCSLVCLLLVFLGIAYYKDKQDSKEKKYIASQYFDIMQYYIIRYTKEGFNKDYSIKRLYWYVMKTNHPLLSIMTIYSEKYYRQLRVLDFFLQLFISFFFTFLPLYASDNEVKVQNENSRNIRNISARFDELGLTIQQILNGIIYSILSNIISMIIILPLTFMIYSDVMKQESEKRKNAMQAMVRYYMTKRKSTYAEKFARGLLKIKALILIMRNKSDLSSKESKLSSVNCEQARMIKSKKRNPHLQLKIKAGQQGKCHYDVVKDKTTSAENHVKSRSVSPNSSRVFIYDESKHIQKRLFSEESYDFEKNVDTSVLEKVNAASFELLHDSFNLPPKASNAKYSILEGERCCLISIPIDSEFRVSCIYCNYSRVYQSSLSPRNLWHKVLSHAKLIIIIGLDIFVLIYLMVFIAGIYQNFGTQIVNLCIVPLITCIILKLMVLPSLMFLVITLLMYYAGPNIYSQKGCSLKVIMFNLIVPPISSSHHQAILLYRAIIRGYK